MRKDTEKASSNTSNNTSNNASNNASNKPTSEHEKKKHGDKRDMMLSRKDAKGGSPSDVSVGGEEDAGVGLEFLVNRKED